MPCAGPWTSGAPAAPSQTRPAARAGRNDARRQRGRLTWRPASIVTAIQARTGLRNAAALAELVLDKGYPDSAAAADEEGMRPLLIAGLIPAIEQVLAARNHAEGLP